MSSTERQLMRLLHGELEAESVRQLEARLAADGTLRARYRRLARAWEDLQPTPGAAIPEGFAAQVMAAARRRSGADELSWARAPAWARAAAAAALVAGLVLGASFGAGSSGVEVAALDAASDQEVYALAEPLSLAESYWLTLETAASDDTVLPAGASGAQRVQ